MSKVVNSNGLDEIFGVLPNINEDIIVDEPSEVPFYGMVNSSRDDEDDVIEEATQNYLDVEMKELIDTCKQLMDAAKYLISSSPDAENISAAAHLITSLGTIMSEFNKATLLKKRYHEVTKLEKLKIRARKEIMHLRAQIESKKVVIGDGNTFIHNTQNNVVSYSQEDIIRGIIEQEKQNLIDN